MSLIQKTMKYTMMIGLLSFVFAFALNIEMSFIGTETINGQTLTTFQLDAYLRNLSNTWNGYPLQFRDILPPRTWDSTGTWDAIFNNLAYIFDWIYFPLNLVLYVVRWFAWILCLVFALFGFTMTVNPETITGLNDILPWLVSHLMIPYI